MNVIPVKEIVREDKDMRAVFKSSLEALIDADPNVVALDSDLLAAAGAKNGYSAAHPENTIDCGIMEANMMGVAAGMSAVGKIPFIHTFGPFATRRIFDQVFISGAYAKLNVKVVGSDPGVVASLNGGTHMPFEDMGLMRLIPNMTVIEMTDNTMLADLLPKIKEQYGMCYIRVIRKGLNKIFENGSTFDIGKAALVRDGKDATVIASGVCVEEAMKAADILAAEGISIRILNMFTWKPIDEEAIIAAAKETGVIVSAENHNVVNGLGSAVSDVLVKNCPVPMEMVGVQDEFGEVGPQGYLAERFGLTAKHIVDAVKKGIARK